MKIARPIVAGVLVLAIALGARGSLLSVTDASGLEFDVRITARLVSSGSTEFALQQQDAGGTWGERQLPTSPVLPGERL